MVLRFARIAASPRLRLKASRAEWILPRPASIGSLWTGSRQESQRCQRGNGPQYASHPRHLLQRVERNQNESLAAGNSRIHRSGDAEGSALRSRSEDMDMGDRTCLGDGKASSWWEVVGCCTSCERKLTMECNVCYHEGEDVKAAQTGAGMEPAQLCEFCRKTSAGQVAVYPRQYSDDSKFTARIVAELYWMLKGDKA